VIAPVSDERGDERQGGEPAGSDSDAERIENALRALDRAVGEVGKEQGGSAAASR
jgi:hypothetical protein